MDLKSLDESIDLSNQKQEVALEFEDSVSINNLKDRLDEYLKNNTIEEVAVKDIGEIKDKIEKGVDEVKEKIEKNVDQIREKLDSNIDNVKEKIEKSVNDINQKIDKNIKTSKAEKNILEKGLGKVYDSIKDTVIEKIAEKVLNVLKNVGKNLYNTTRSVFNKVKVK